MENLSMKQIIKEKYNSLSRKEKEVADYVLSNYYQSMLLSSMELAKLSNTSHTAVIRYTKSLGFSGFMEYKNTIKKEYVSTQKVYTSLNLMDRETSGSFLNKYLDSVKKETKNFINNFDYQRMTKLVDMISECRKLYLVGFGSDEVVVNYLRNYLNVMGIECITVCDEGLRMKEAFMHLDKDDMVFLVAYPTIMESEHWVSKYTKLRGAKLFLLTDSNITANELDADFYFAFYEKEELFFNSYILQMIFCNALLIEIYEKYEEKTSGSMKKYHELLQL